MKKLFALFSLVLMLVLVGCNATEQNQQTDKGDFKFCSLEWGADWGTIQKNDVFKNADITGDENQKTIQLENGKYLEIPIGEIGLVFSTNGIGDTAGLAGVMVKYDEENEQTLLTKLEELYGERKTTYTDKNGVENPISPAGWVADTIESVLTEQEKEYYLDIVPEGMEQSRIDALLRAPLVSIKFDEEHNLIEFNGNNAAIVSYIQAELKK